MTTAILAFHRAPGEGRKGTGVVDVAIARTSEFIGTIRWYQPYRQYVFEPKTGASVRYTVSVLLEIRRHMKSMMRAWAKRASEKEAYVKGDYAVQE